MAATRQASSHIGPRPRRWEIWATDILRPSSNREVTSVARTIPRSKIDRGCILTRREQGPRKGMAPVLARLASPINPKGADSSTFLSTWQERHQDHHQDQLQDQVRVPPATKLCGFGYWV